MSVPDPSAVDWVPLWNLGTSGPIPIGAPIPWLLSAIPAGYLEFDGQAITQAAYPQLYALFGANLPDLRGRVLMGQDAGHAIATSGGSATHTLAESEMPSHEHSPINGYWFTSRYYSGNSGIGEIAGYLAASNSFTGLGGANFYSTSMASRGGSAAHNNLQPYRTVRWITAAA